MRRQDGRWRLTFNYPAEMDLADALYAAPSDEERRRLLADEPDLRVVEGVIRLAYRFGQAGKYEEAEQALAVTRWVVIETKPLYLPRVALNQGINQVLQGHHAQALKFYLEAKALSEKQGGDQGGRRAGVDQHRETLLAARRFGTGAGLHAPGSRRCARAG